MRPRRRRVVLPIVFFVTTCVSTFEAGTVRAAPDAGWLDQLWCGLQFAVPLMTILVCHEMGHFLQAHRYRVPASLPYFIPMPSLIGTMGRDHLYGACASGAVGALFDIGISGPLAGSGADAHFLRLGIISDAAGARVVPRSHPALGSPLLFDWLLRISANGILFGSRPASYFACTRRPSPAGSAC